MNKLFSVALLSALALASFVHAMDHINQMDDQQFQQFSHILGGALTYWRVQPHLVSAAPQSTGNQHVGHHSSNSSQPKQVSWRVQEAWKVRH